MSGVNTSRAAGFDVVKCDFTKEYDIFYMVISSQPRSPININNIQSKFKFNPSEK